MGWYAAYLGGPASNQLTCNQHFVAPAHAPALWAAFRARVFARFRVRPLPRSPLRIAVLERDRDRRLLNQPELVDAIRRATGAPQAVLHSSADLATPKAIVVKRSTSQNGVELSHMKSPQKRGCLFVCFPKEGVFGSFDCLRKFSPICICSLYCHFFAVHFCLQAFFEVFLLFCSAVLTCLRHPGVC